MGYVAGGANNDPRLLLVQNKNAWSGPKPAPFSGRVPFVSKGSQKFLAIAKNRAWGNPAWASRHWTSTTTSNVENMHSVNLQPLGIPWSWAEENDHAKLCLSDRNNAPKSPHWV